MTRPADKMMNPRLLSADEFRATFTERMINTKGQEEALHPEGVIDLDPYLLPRSSVPAPEARRPTSRCNGRSHR